MSECNPVKTPGEIQKKKTNYLINKEEIDNRFYREVIGALMYLVVGTRPDIANTVSRLAQFVNEPCQQDWLAVKRILRLGYLQETVARNLDQVVSPASGRPSNAAALSHLGVFPNAIRAM
ncbi:Copia protein [Eumeta japonica]|uniref:Copia protein n=1 Tax=Eumeta variegata TaxID=151549 RepID=A0A4C1VA62_EUMVA|nr:Copia protein [Eumeta japonica]